MADNKHTMMSEGGIDFGKYYRLVKRKIWTIIAIFSVVFVLWMIAAIRLGPHPEYSTNALLQFEDRRALSAVETRGRVENESKIGLLLSRNFLGKVVAKLSMGLKVQNVSRYSFIDSVHLNDGYLLGSYVLKKKDEHLQLFFTNKDKTIEDKKVLDMPYPKSNAIEYGGFKLFMKETFWQNHDKVGFRLRSKAKAVESLRNSLGYLFQNRARTLASITIKGTDRYFITDVLNTLIDAFVLQNLDVKKFHTREVLNILTEQLQTAQAELDKAEGDLKKFRESNPWVGLTGDVNGVVNGISVNEANKTTIKNRKAELSMLLQRLNTSSGDNRYAVLNEILSFLSAQGLPTVPALTSEFTNLTTERTRLLSSYAPSHKFVTENAKKIQELEKKVLMAAGNQLSQYDAEVTRIQKEIDSNTYKIKHLPAKEMQLAELQRKRSVSEQIYSSLLVRYNQAKIADAVEVGDIIILDPAVVPQASSKMKIYLKYGLIGLILGFAFGIGFVIISNLLDKTVRTSEELEKLVSMRVLAKIPKIETADELDARDFDAPVRIDPKLVTADYSPSPVGEAYRSLRTQLLVNNKNVKSIFITSLNPSEGKSLNAGNLAITFAQQKLPTLLIDGDIRRGVIHHSFACQKKPGLSDFLYSNADITDENIRKIIQQTHIPNLYLISSGRPVPNPSEILGGQRGKDVFTFLKKRFGFMIVDSPPISVTSDSVVISQYVDAGLFVVRAGKSNVEQMKAKISEYKDFSDSLAGVVLNFTKVDVKKSHYHYSYYNY